MLYLAITFLATALISGLLGFGGMAAAAAVAQPVFFVSLVLFVITLTLKVRHT